MGLMKAKEEIMAKQMPIGRPRRQYLKRIFLALFNKIFAKKNPFKVHWPKDGRKSMENDENSEEILHVGSE
jgi:hypothetical protein